jgi:hypothetical protein
VAVYVVAQYINADRILRCASGPVGSRAALEAGSVPDNRQSTSFRGVSRNLG